MGSWLPLGRWDPSLVPLHLSISWQEYRGVGAAGAVWMMGGLRGELGCARLPGEPRRVPALTQLSKSTFPTKTLVWHFPVVSCPMLL